MRYLSLFILLIFTQNIWASPFCAETFSPYQFKSKEIHFSRLTNFKKPLPVNVKNDEYLLSWMMDGSFRIYMRQVTPYKNGVPGYPNKMEMYYKAFQKYKEGRHTFFSFGFWKSGQWHRSLKDHLIQYAIDVKNTPLRILWTPHDPSEFTNQSLKNKIISSPSHYLVHPIAEVTGSYRQFSIVGGFLFFSGVLGGVGYYKTHKHTENINLVQELILNDERFFNFQQLISSGHLSFDDIAPTILSLKEEMDNLDSTEDLEQTELWKPIKKLKDKGFFKMDSDYGNYLGEYFKFYKGHSNLNDIRKSLRFIGEDYNDKKFAILTSFGSYIPSFSQEKAYNALNSDDDSLTKELLKLSMSDYMEVQRVLKRKSYRDNLERNYDRVEAISREFNLSLEQKEKIQNELNNFIVKSDETNWDENLRTFDTFITELGLPMQTSFFLMDSYLDDQKLQFPIEINISSNSDKTKTLKMKSELLAYALANPAIAGNYNFYEQEGEVVHLQGLIGNVVRGEKIKNIFHSSMPKDKNELYRIAVENRIFPELADAKEVPQQLKVDLVQKMISYELYRHKRLNQTDNGLKEYRRSEDIHKRFLQSMPSQ